MGSNAAVHAEPKGGDCLAQGKRALPSAVLGFAAPIEAGKTTISQLVAKLLGAPRVSFGEYLKGIAIDQGLEVTRETLQDLGDQLVRKDVSAFCENVLQSVPWAVGKPLIVDGVRHAEALDAISSLLAPASVYLVYIEVDRTTQTKRLEKDPLRHQKSLEELERHPTETQVRSVLPDRASFFLDGTDAPEESARKIVEFLDAAENVEHAGGWDTLNAKRIELAKKKSRGELAGADIAEFDRLQTQYFEYLDAKFPRTPLDPEKLDAIERRLGSS